MISVRRSLGWSLVGMSLLLHIFTIFCFSRQPDHLAAFTVMPIWLWGGIGLFLAGAATLLLRHRLSLVVPGIWAITLLIGADEARTLTTIGKPGPRPGPPADFQGSPVLRVVTLNCAHFSYGDPIPDLKAWHPDIVLLQQIHPHQAVRAAKLLYDGEGQFLIHRTNALISRWSMIQRDPPPGLETARNQHVTLTLADGSPLHLVNAHLSSAATDLRLWSPDAWREHYHNRTSRKNELANALAILQQTANFPDEPTLFGGDFNASATDVVHRQLTGSFRNAFASAGTGWGNTYHRRFPILRIDHLYTTHQLRPVRARAYVTRKSDHRMVVADFLLLRRPQH
jgi:endonuclease/exonuclease/phosphatase (EEP) superfamily protein YafD